MGIDKYLKVIKEGVFGRDVRQAIHDGIEQVYEDATFDGNTNMEVAKARGTNSTLSERLQNMDGTVASYAKEVETTGKRLDGIVANAGNGSVPSELIDMRTGADGRVHITAGAAMREQFKSALTGERQIASPSDLVPPYNDLNTLKPNTILTYAYYGEV
ncbi:hypothetical protein, partial [Streptococcus pneumoniae]|uniref:hypothetical protein n=1 Tax=Streptococcus pneumoniae TaxID=1313 RepID=UPI0031CC3DCF